jgi:hypothetical protein
VLGEKWDLVKLPGTHDVVIKLMSFSVVSDYVVKTLRVNFQTNRSEYDSDDYREVILNTSTASKAAYIPE